MAGKNVPKVSFNGIEKDYWIEGKDSYAHLYNDPSSMHINYELLAMRGTSSKEAASPKTKTVDEKAANFVQLGKVSLNLR